MDTGPLVIPDPEPPRPTSCRRCGKPFSPQTMTFQQRDIDQWGYKLDAGEDPWTFITQPGEGNYWFVALDTEAYWLECECGEEYACESWDGVHTLQEDV